MRTLLEKVELAILANGGFAYKKEWCKCDPSVGQVPCEYCVIHDALDDAFHFLKALKANDMLDARFVKRSYESTNQLLNHFTFANPNHEQNHMTARQLVINVIVGGVMGYACGEIYTSGKPVLATVVAVAWMVGIINSLIPRQ